MLFLAQHGIGQLALLAGLRNQPNKAAVAAARKTNTLHTLFGENKEDLFLEAGSPDGP